MEIFKTKKEAQESSSGNTTGVIEYPCPKCSSKIFEALKERGCPFAGQGVCPYCEQKLVRTHFPMKEHNIILQYGNDAINMGSLSDFTFSKK